MIDQISDHQCHYCISPAHTFTFEDWGEKRYWCADCYCLAHHISVEALHAWMDAQWEGTWAGQEYQVEAAAQAEDRATWARDQRVRGGWG